MTHSSSLKMNYTVVGHDSFDREFYSFWKPNPTTGKLCPEEFNTIREAVNFAETQRLEFKKTEHLYGEEDKIFIVDIRSGMRYPFRGPKNFAEMIQEEEAAIQYVQEYNAAFKKFVKERSEIS